MLEGTPQDPEDNPLKIKNDAELCLELLKFKI
jgi:hypothetical protein